MSQTCPNCHLSCISCAGRQLVLASDGTQVCTGCLNAYELSKGRNPNQVRIEHPSPNNEGSTAPVIKSITYKGPSR